MMIFFHSGVFARLVPTLVFKDDEQVFGKSLKTQHFLSNSRQCSISRQLLEMSGNVPK